MFIERTVGGFVGGIRKNQEEIQRWKETMAAKGYRLVTKRFRGRLRFQKWSGPWVTDRGQQFLFHVPASKKRKKRRRA